MHIFHISSTVIPLLKPYLTDDVNMNKQPVVVIYETLICDGSQGLPSHY